MINSTFCELIKCHRNLDWNDGSSQSFWGIIESKEVICRSSGGYTFVCYYINPDGTICDLADNDHYYRPKIAVAAALVKARNENK